MYMIFVSSINLYDNIKYIYIYICIFYRKKIVYNNKKKN